eukprot:9498555-Pyramimonas_sp.AAC.2
MRGPQGPRRGGGVPGAPPRRGRLRGIPPQREDRLATPQAGGVQRRVSYDDNGLTRQCVRPNAVGYWLDQGRAEHDVRRWCALSIELGGMTEALSSVPTEARAPRRRAPFGGGASRGPSSMTGRSVGVLSVLASIMPTADLVAR